MPSRCWELDRIKALAVTVAMRGFISRGGPLLRQCWQHSAAAAIIAEEISPIFNVKGDVAYTIGLLHDIGRLGLLKTYAAEYSPLLGCSFETVEQVLRTERALLKVDHGVRCGRMVGEELGFPAGVRASVRTSSLTYGSEISRTSSSG